MWQLRIGTAVGVLIVFLFIGRSESFEFGQASSAVRTPFTVAISERYVDPGTRTVTSEVQLITAFRSDGSTANTRTSGGEVMSRQVLDVPGRRTVVVADTEQTKSTRYFSDQERQSMLVSQRPPDCAPNPNEKPIREETLLGVKVFVFETDSPLGLNRVRMSRWVAPELRCTEIKSIADKLNGSGALLARTEKLPVSVQAGEPDGVLFQVPESYKELPPSAMQQGSYEMRAKRAAPPNLLSSWAVQDKKYFDSQQHKP